MPKSTSTTVLAGVKTVIQNTRSFRQVSLPTAFMNQLEADARLNGRSVAKQIEHYVLVASAVEHAATSHVVQSIKSGDHTEELSRRLRDLKLQVSSRRPAAQGNLDGEFMLSTPLLRSEGSRSPAADKQSVEKKPKRTVNVKPHKPTISKTVSTAACHA